jgi:serine/threonine-protein kinase
MVIGGKFVLTRLLGEGGLATVFEARHATLGRRVAIKVLNERFAADAEAVARLQREAVTASSIEHPNIVEIFDIAQDAVDGSFFIVQRLMLGADLRDYLHARPRPGIVESLDLLVPVMGALDAVHRLGIIHRDIKPENIFLARTHAGSLTPTLIDFGIAKVQGLGAGGPKSEQLSRAGTLLGTPHYVAPEQACGERVDARVDVWAIGVVLYEMLAGRRPFEAPSPQLVLMKVATEAVPPIEKLVSLPKSLRAVVHRALERDPARRYASMAEMLRALLAVSLEKGEREQLRAGGSAQSDELGAFLADRHRASLGTLPEDVQPPSGGRDLSASFELEAAPPPQEPLRRSSLQLASIFDDDDASLSRADITRMRGSHHAPRAVELSREDERAPAPASRSVDAAYEALQLNALEDCVARAEEALAKVGGDAVLLGKLRLLQATARYWLGHWRDAEWLAHQALEHLAPGTGAWLTALGTRITIAGIRGKLDAVYALAELLRSAPRGLAPAIPRVVAACRLSTELLRAGHVEQCVAWLALARKEAEAVEEREVVDGWIDGVRAELAANEGDVGEALRLYEASAAAFGEAGDSRNACRQRSNVGDLLLSLGAHREAAEVLAAALESAQPMGVYFVSALLANLGCALLRLGNSAAADVLGDAVAMAHAQGNGRAEAFTRAYLAQALAAAEPSDLVGAEREARASLELGASSPASRAYALAVLADLSLRRGNPDDALASAREACRRLEEHHGAEGAELFIRATLASALVARGEHVEARAVAFAARGRLLASAGRIADPQLRASFLERVPENARTLELVRRLSAL